MKTYSKQSRCEDTENCRLCLNMTKNTLDIFESRAVCIEELLATSINIIVSVYDGLPSKICKTCYEFLIKLSSFKAQCKTADEWLRQSSSAKNSELEISSSSSNTQLVIEDLQSHSNRIEVKKDISNSEILINQKLSPKGSSSTQVKRDIKVNILHEWEDANVDSYEGQPNLNSSKQQISFSHKEESKYIDKSCKDTTTPEKKEKGGENICPTCKKSFRFRQSMLRHLSLHSGEKKYMCTICGGKFSQLGVLKRHSILHTKTKPLSCDVCGKGFIQKSNLNTHKRKHLESDAVNFPCELCDKVFKFASGRSRHILQHKGVQYSCTVCSKVMNDLSSFKRHKKRHADEK